MYKSLLRFHCYCFSYLLQDCSCFFFSFCINSLVISCYWCLFRFCFYSWSFCNRSFRNRFSRFLILCHRLRRGIFLRIFSYKCLYESIKLCFKICSVYSLLNRFPLNKFCLVVEDIWNKREVYIVSVFCIFNVYLILNSVSI